MIELMLTRRIGHARHLYSKKWHKITLMKLSEVAIVYQYVSQLMQVAMSTQM